MSLVINLLDQFQDPRDPKKVWHPLSSILFISICAIFSGAEGWEDIVTWAEVNKKWLSKHVNLSKCKAPIFRTDHNWNFSQLNYVQKLPHSFVSKINW